MANAALLERLVKESGKTKTHLAIKARVSRPRLDTIISDPESATLFQAESLCEELRIDEKARREIFLP